jgi:hypothetical protein
MLVSSKTALLLSKDTDFIARYETVAQMCNVELTVRSEWNERYRINQDVAIAEGELAYLVASAYKNRLVLVFSGSIAEMRAKADRFIFNKENLNELIYAFLKIDNSVKVKDTRSVTSIVISSGRSVFKEADYDFDFANSTFRYKGKEIYVSSGQKIVLAKWLLLGERGNNCYVQIHQMRKNFGKDFLSDISKYGEVIK